MRMNSIPVVALMYFRLFFPHQLEENYLLQQILISVWFWFCLSLDDKHFLRWQTFFLCKSNHFMKAHLKHLYPEMRLGFEFILFKTQLHWMIPFVGWRIWHSGWSEFKNRFLYTKCNWQDPSWTLMQNFVLPKEQKCVSEGRWGA